ncbi:PAS domain S-box protein [bacterium]|nr:PAS domain S-box protein [bacterium]
MELNLLLASILFLSCVLTLILFYKTFLIREKSGAFCFALLMLSLTIWMFFQGLELLSFSTPTKVTLSKLSYMGIVFIGPFFFSFVYGYINKIHWSEISFFRWLLLIPFAVLGLVFTNEQHHLIWSHIEESKLVPRLIYHHGLGLITFAVYSYILVGISFFLLLIYAYNQRSLFRYRIIWLMLAALIPLISSMAYLFNWTSIDNLDFSAVAITLSSIICAITVYQYNLFSIRPVANQVLFDQMPDGVIALDTQHRLIFSNPSISKWFHISETDSGKDIFTLIPAIQKEQIQQYDIPFEFNVRYSDSITKSFEMTSYALTIKSRYKGKTGTLIRIADISNRKWQESQIIQKENILAKFLELSRHYISSNSLQNTILSSLQVLGELFRVDRVYIYQNNTDPETKREYYSQRWEWNQKSMPNEFKHQELQVFDNTIFPPHWNSFLKDGKYVISHLEDFSEQIRSIDSSRNVQSILIQPITILQKFWGFLGFDDCISKRIWTLDEINSIGIAASMIGEFIDHSTTQLELQHSQKRFDQVTELAHEVFWEVDEEGYITYISPYIYNILGYEPEFLINKIKFFDLVKYEKSNHTTLNVISDLFVSHSSLSDFQLSIQANDQSVLHCIVNALPIFEDGKFTGYRGSAFDISELKRLENMKTEFISTVSHELRTPLTAIKESIHIVSDGLLGEINASQKETLEIGMRNITRLSRIVNNVLDFQKQNTEKMIYSPHDIDPIPLLLEAFETMKLHANEKNLEMKWKVNDNLPKLYADSDQIMQVLINLLHNAIKFTDQGSITLEAFPEEDKLHIIVSDTGIGIKQTDMKKLFLSFSQINSTNQTSPGGSGLGLAISKQIINWHDGEIWADSEFKKGSQFHILIPFQSNHSKEKR